MTTVSVYPEYEIIAGIFTSIGMAYPPIPGSTSAGTLTAEIGEISETTEVKVVGFGRVNTDILDISWKAIPMIYIAPLGDSLSHDGAHQAVSTPTYRVHYIADNRGETLTSSPLASGNPAQVVILRTSMLRALADSAWKDFGTPYRVNATIGGVSLENGFENHFQRQNVLRICGSFDIDLQFGWYLPV